MSSSTTSSPQSVVDAGRFRSPYPVHLAFFEESPWFKSDYLAVADINGNVIFKVKGNFWTLRSRQLVYDASKTPIISLQQKLATFHDRWKVFASDSSDSKHLLFTMKRSSAFQLKKTKLHVFLAGNTKEEKCDFMVKGSYRKKTCAVYKGDSSIVVAQMSKNCEGASSSLPKRKSCFWMALNANVDYCFITALVIVLRHLHQDKKDAEGELAKAAVELALLPISST